MLLLGNVCFKCRLMHVYMYMYEYLMKKQKESSLENITWSKMGKQNVQAKEVNCDKLFQHGTLDLESCFRQAANVRLKYALRQKLNER